MKIAHQSWVRLLFASAMLALWSGIACAWQGFDWDIWRDITGVEAPKVVSPQAGVQELTPLLLSDSENNTDLVKWDNRRRGIIAVLSALLGEPSAIQRDRKPPQTGAPVQEAGYTRTSKLSTSAKNEPIFPAPNINILIFS